MIAAEFEAEFKSARKGREISKQRDGGVLARNDPASGNERADTGGFPDRLGSN